MEKPRQWSTTAWIALTCHREVVWLSPPVFFNFPFQIASKGYNISIIAYGQTGSGKTYTIFGPGLLYAMNEADFGMVPRSVRHIFYKKKV